MAVGRRTLVTGAGGFVGANLTRRLLEQGALVNVFVRPGGSRRRLHGLDVECVEVDLRDAGALASAVARVRPEAVFHLAAHGAYSWQTDRDGIFASNLGGTLNLLDACRDCELLVNTGSSSEYGHVDHAPREDEAPRPNSDYAVAKTAATLYTSHVARLSGSRFVTLRLYSAYGPWEDERRLVPTLVEHALRGTLPSLAGRHVARDFVFVDDVVDAYLAVGTAEAVEPGAIFNVGSGVQTSLGELVEVARALFGVAEEPTWGSMPNRAWDTTVWRSDPALAAQTLGWRATTTLEDGLRATADWLRTA